MGCHLRGKISLRQSSNLAAKVSYLASTAAYDHSTRNVETRETHRSWIFLTDNRVFKLKKPVKETILNFSTINRRRHYCEEELRLNRRLAFETYLGVTTLRRDRSGQFNLGKIGRIVDWLVEMERLPATDMLDERIRAGNVASAEIEKIAKVLADFYASCAPVTTEGQVYLNYIAEQQRINRSELLRPEFQLGAQSIEALDAVDGLLKQLRPEIEARATGGGFVEGHGDLRPEHVCLNQPPQIIDCLEFNRSMRIVDPYDEINYLGLECEMLGASWIGAVLLAALERHCPKRPSQKLMALYGGFRMLLRARLCIVHLLEKPVRKAEKWQPLAIRYIQQAQRELFNLRSREAPRSTHVNGAA